MAQLVVDNLEDEIRNKLQELAHSHGRSVEEEAREILRGAILNNVPPGPKGLGSRIAARFAGLGHNEGFEELRGCISEPPSPEE